MTVKTESKEVATPRSLGRFILSEGVLLALASAAAYAVAFRYETGYADYFRYPYWLIEVSWIVVLRAWGTLLTLGIILLSLAFLFVNTMPASAADVIRSRFAAVFSVLGLLGALGWYLMSDRDQYLSGLLLFLFAGGVLCLLAIQVKRIHLATPRNGRLARWAITIRIFGASAPKPGSSLATALLGDKILGRPSPSYWPVFFFCSASQLSQRQWLVE